MVASSDLAVAALGTPVGGAEADVLVGAWMGTANIAGAVPAGETAVTGAGGNGGGVPGGAGRRGGPRRCDRSDPAPGARPSRRRRVPTPTGTRVADGGRGHPRGMEGHRPMRLYPFTAVVGMQDLALALA